MGKFESMFIELPTTDFDPQANLAKEANEDVATYHFIRITKGCVS